MPNIDQPISNADGLKDLNISEDDTLYLMWAREIGCSLEVRLPTQNWTQGEDFVPSIRRQIDDWFEHHFSPVLDAYWEQYIEPYRSNRRVLPPTVLQSELSVCIGRLRAEYYRNAMINMGNGHYDSMVDLIRDSVLKNCPFSPLVQRIFELDARIVKEANYDYIIHQTFSGPFQVIDVEVSLDRLAWVVVAWCLAHPEPIAYTSTDDD